MPARANAGEVDVLRLIEYGGRPVEARSLFFEQRVKRPDQPLRLFENVVEKFGHLSKVLCNELRARYSTARVSKRLTDEAATCLRARYCTNVTMLYGPN